MTEPTEPALPPPTAVIQKPLIHNRNFALLWSSQTASLAGFSATLIVFPLLVLAITGSPADSGIVLGVASAAQLVAGLPAGALADRWNRKKIMVGCEAAQALAVAVLVGTLWLHTVSVPVIIVVAAVLGGAKALFVPAEMACLPAVVPVGQLSSAVALNVARAGVGQLSGTAAGGFLFAIGRAVPFVADALTHALATVALCFLRLPERPRTRAPLPQLGREIVAGLRWSWRQPHVRITALCAITLNFFFTAYYVVIIVLAKMDGSSSGEIGVMAAMLGLGGIVGSLAAPYLLRKLSPYQSIIGVFLVMALITPLAVFIHSGYLMGALFAGMALVPPTANTTINTYQLLLTPDDLRGRLSGVMAVVGGVSTSTGPAFGGVLMQVFPGHAAVLLCTAGIAGLTLLFALNPTLRTFPRPDSVGQQTTQTVETH
ncbi:MAG TPA: MFS transporter [Pseudonocardiaceae bacterium]|jgi:MFS family permease|nr:MFS transporter [Pseudonocardiaceae bacterium]